MTPKTPEEIEREKALVEKLMGAKGAMIGALERIATLEHTIDRMVSDIECICPMFGEHHFLKGYLPGKRTEVSVMTAKDVLLKIAKNGRDVK